MQNSTPATNPTVGTTPVSRDRTWRAGHTGPILLFIGSILWLIGSALLSGSQKRFASTIEPGAPGSVPTLTTGVVFTSPFLAGIILWILGAISWIFSSLIMLSSAFTQATVVTVSGVRPGLAKLSIVSGFLQLISAILLLIGASILAGENLSTASSGSIVLLCGFILFTMALLFQFAVSFIASTAVAIMITPSQKLYSWGSTTAFIVLIVANVLYIVGTIAMVVRDPPGLFYIGAIIHLIASTYMVFGSYLLSRESYGNFTPILSFVTTMPMATTTTGAVATNKGGTVGPTGSTGTTFSGTNPMLGGPTTTSTMAVHGTPVV